MNTSKFLQVSLLLVIFLPTSAVLSQINQRNNSIEGFVFDAVERRPVADVYVELLNDFYSTIGRQKTDATGRYGFRGLSAGNFKIRVLPYGTNYQEETQDVTLGGFVIGNRTTTDNAYVDIYLRLDKRKIKVYDSAVLGSVFIQDVPESAKKLYREGIEKLGKSNKDNEPGLETIKKSLAIFPDYYEALIRLGLEYIKTGQFNEAVPFLIKAVTVNQRSFSGYFLLGISAYNLKQYTDAAEAFRAATVINPQFADTYVQYGMVLRIDGRYEEAEKVLLKGESLSKDSPISEINWQLALLYDKTQRYSEAAEQLEKYLKIEKDIKNSKQIKTLISQMKAKSKK